MRILLDECVPWPTWRILSRHQCSSVQQQGWGGIKNGDLLALAAGEFELFITADQNIRYQQNLTAHPISILELSTNDLRCIRAAAEVIRSAISSIQNGELCRVDIP